MGDRCFLSIMIHGHVETVATLNAIVEALQGDGLTATDCSDDHPKYAAEFLRAIRAGQAPLFNDQACNHAAIDAAEEALQMIGIPYYVTHEEGGDYGPGCWSWTAQRGTVKAARGRDCGPIIEAAVLREALDGDHPLLGVTTIIQQALLAEGPDLPQFTVSDAVREELELATQPPQDLFPEEDWRYEVANGDTRLGYKDWLKGKLESEA